MKGFIYELRNNNCNETYIGSTKNIQQRIRQHRYNSTKGKESKRLLYRIIREMGGYDDWEFNVLEEIECNNREELFAYEKLMIAQLKPSLNINHYLEN
tara:strand:+ start:4447 stop:4740 length:294 start_codon:yes stop_codon:yes gene_type:complete